MLYVCAYGMAGGRYSARASESNNLHNICAAKQRCQMTNRCKRSNTYDSLSLPRPAGTTAAAAVLFSLPLSSSFYAVLLLFVSWHIIAITTVAMPDNDGTTCAR